MDTAEPHPQDTYPDSRQKVNVAYMEAYKQLQFSYRSLQHQFSILDNEFQMYASQTAEKIARLEADMDKMLEQRDCTIRNLTLENRNLAEQNLTARDQVEELKLQLEKIAAAANNEQVNFKTSVHSFQKNESRYRQIVTGFEKELKIKTEQLQSLKQILNNQRITLVSKQHLCLDKQRQIAELHSQIKALNYELQTQKNIEDTIRDSNYKLKQQVEELRKMFEKMELQFRHCHKCKMLQIKNMELQARLKQAASMKQNRTAIDSRSHLKTSYSIGKQNMKTIQSLEGYSIQRRPTTRRHMKNISLNTFETMSPSIELSPGPRLKESVFRRCKFMLDTN